VPQGCGSPNGLALPEMRSNAKLLLGDTFTVADAYFFIMLRWAHSYGIDLSPSPTLGAYFDRVAARPAVIATLKAEGQT